LTKFKFYSIRTRVKVILHEDQYAYFSVNLSFPFGMKNVSDKFVGKIEMQILS